MAPKGMETMLGWAGKSKPVAYDIRFLSGYKSRQFDCMTLNPEAMHHYTPLRHWVMSVSALKKTAVALRWSRRGMRRRWELWKT
jgi:hypothetical protein